MAKKNYSIRCILQLVSSGKSPHKSLIKYLNDKQMPACWQYYLEGCEYGCMSM